MPIVFRHFELFVLFFAGTIMYQYFVKVVPTTYVNVEGAVLFTSQYSVTKHQKVSSTPQLVFWPNVLMFCLFVISIYQHFNYLSGTFVWLNPDCRINNTEVHVQNSNHNMSFSDVDVRIVR